jgi:branched-chain amino acid transport system ATP-binding protein
MTDSATISVNERLAPDPVLAPTPILELRDLHASYGAIEVLHGMDMIVPAGGIFAVLGPNGAGKSTMLRVVAGLHAPSGGSVLLGGRDVVRARPDELARRGVCLIPEGRGVFPNLTVEENLRLIGHLGASMSEIEQRTYEQFPRLAERRKQLAGTMSGGEQQMLALARVLRMGARLLLCDEPTEGLSPLLVTQVGDILRRAKGQGLTVLLVEQNLRFATTVADRHYLLAEGRVVEELANDQVREREHELLAYLGI